MTAKRWENAKRVFHEALEWPTTARARFVREAAAGDENLQNEVDALLGAHPDAEAFFAEVVPAAPAVFVAGTRIGPYRLVAELGRGGMGTVYLAERDDVYRKEVAVKIVSDGRLTASVEKFRQERQILASLDHPNIARLLDGGTTDEGLPYLVMEYVEGVPIDVYCEMHELTIDERLKLFRAVCSAVEYAHHNLIVHRDLKPRNILVRGDGTPKLLDFGIAKMMAAGSEQPPAATAFLMTPEYASPEQIRGDPIATTTDVYALGVLLYRLLTGRSPYRPSSEAAHELARAICEQEPERPSAAVAPAASPDKWRRRLSGDLDTIVLKAIRKEPSRRYASVERFSEDIRRHLEALPVHARPDTIRYRAGKFIARHMVAVGAAAIVAVTLVAGILATSWQAWRAETERDRAERRFNDVRQLANAYLFEFHDAIKDLPGATPARHLVVQRALQYLDNLARESAGEPSLQRELAAAYERIGDIQGGRYAQGNLGRPAEAKGSYLRALAVREALVRAAPQDRANRAALAESHRSLSAVLVVLSEYPAAVEHARRAVSIREALAAEQSGDLDARRALAVAYDDLSRRLALQGQERESRDIQQQALRLWEQIAASGTASLADRFTLAGIYHADGVQLVTLGQLQKGLDQLQRAANLLAEIHAREPGNLRYAQDYANTLLVAGDVLRLLGNDKEAIASMRKAIDIRALAGGQRSADANDLLFRLNGHHMLAVALSNSGAFDEAIENHRSALQVARALLALDSRNGIAREAMAGSEQRLAETLERRATIGGLAPEARARVLREARSSYHASRERFMELRAAGVLQARFTNRPEEIALRLAQIDHKLAAARGQ